MFFPSPDRQICNVWPPIRTWFFFCNCKRMYFQLRKLTNIFYFGTGFIHLLAQLVAWTPTYGAFFLSKFNLLVVFTFNLRFSISVFLLFNLDIRFSTSTFVLFNLDSRFLSSTFILFKHLFQWLDIRHAPGIQKFYLLKKCKLNVNACHGNFDKDSTFRNEEFVTARMNDLCQTET